MEYKELWENIRKVEKEKKYQLTEKEKEVIQVVFSYLKEAIKHQKLPQMGKTRKVLEFINITVKYKSIILEMHYKKSICIKAINIEPGEIVDIDLISEILEEIGLKRQDKKIYIKQKYSFIYVVKN